MTQRFGRNRLFQLTAKLLQLPEQPVAKAFQLLFNLREMLLQVSVDRLTDPLQAFENLSERQMEKVIHRLQVFDFPLIVFFDQHGIESDLPVIGLFQRQDGCDLGVVPVDLCGSCSQRRPFQLGLLRDQVLRDLGRVSSGDFGIALRHRFPERLGYFFRRRAALAAAQYEQQAEQAGDPSKIYLSEI